MTKFLFFNSVLLGINFFSILQCVTTNTNNCNTLQLGPNEPLLISIYDKNYEADKALWKNVCDVIKTFPRGLITMKYRPGALATKNFGHITCGSGSCKIDQYHGCELLHYKYIDDCYREAEGDSAVLIATVNCYCDQKSNQLLLDNAGLRIALNIPETAIPALAFNEEYDPCAKTRNFEDLKNYVCQVYQYKVGPC